MKNKPVRNRIFTLGFVLLFTATTLFSPLAADAKGKSGSADYKAGDNICIGKLDKVPINWTILNFDAKTREALVVSKTPLYSISVRNYKSDIAANYRGKSTGFVQWANNYWRYWLNSTFYDSVFTPTEKQMIVPTNISVASHQSSILNFYHDTTLDSYYLSHDKTKNSLTLAIYNNQQASTDNVFFLSSDDYTNYKDKINTEQKGIWPLRTNAYDDPVKSLYVNDTKGLIDRLYTYDSALSGIRPAMTLKLSDAPVEQDKSKEKSTATNTTADANASTAKAEDTKDTSSNKEKNEDKTSEEKDTGKTQTNSKAKTQTATSKKSTSNTKSKNKATQRFRRSYSNNAKDISTAAKSGNTISLPNDANYSMKKNSSASIALDLGYLNSTGKDFTVTYKSSDASIFTVDSAGNISSGSKNGSATLTVRMKKSNGKTYNMTCRIDVS